MKVKFSHYILTLILSVSTISSLFASGGSNDGGFGAKSSIPLSINARKWAYFEPYLRASYSKWSIHGGLGLSAYNGDLSSPINFRLQRYHLNPNLSLGVSYRWTNYISFKLETTLFKLYSESRRDTLTETSFVGRNAEWSLSLVHDLFPKTDVEFYSQRWNPYAFVGIGQTYFSPRDVETGDALRPQRNNFDYEYSKIAMVIPFGVGINYYFRDYFSLGFEVGYRYTTTDFLDDVAQRRDDKAYTNDKYLLYGLKLNYQFIYLKKYKYRNHLKTGW